MPASVCRPISITKVSQKKQQTSKTMPGLWAREGEKEKLRKKINTIQYTVHTEKQCEQKSYNLNISKLYLCLLCLVLTLHIRFFSLSRISMLYTNLLHFSGSLLVVFVAVYYFKRTNEHTDNRRTMKPFIEHC